MLTALITAVAFATASAASTDADAKVVFDRKQDVVYGRKFGTALTMDIFTPKGESNGATVIWVVSGGWYSSHDAITVDKPHSPLRTLLGRGYTVCAVVHGSNPLFTIEDAIDDIQRAVRFINYRAAEDSGSTVPIGIIGGSAGGHLSLMAGTSGDEGDPKAQDPVSRMPSRVQAVACYFPPTDFLNYGEPEVNVLETTVGELFVAPFQFRRLNADTRAFDLVTTPSAINEILEQVSPATHVTADDAPTLIIHGDNDLLVPYQQGELIVEKLTAADVEAELVRKPGAGHGWANIEQDHELLADWMDKHLLPLTAAGQGMSRESSSSNRP